MYDDRLANLPVRIDDVTLERRERDTSSDFTRVTTIISLSGPGPDGERVVGHGEDVTYDTDEHDALARTGLPDLAGEYTIDSFSAHVGTLDCFPAGSPDRKVFRNYRRWGIESAALDLALRQAGTGLADALDRDPGSLRFVASTRLGDPPTVDRVASLLDRVPALQLKLDPTGEWTDEVIDALVDTGAVRILDLKGQYEGTDVDAPGDPDLYRRLLEAFPDAVIEDPALTDETRALFDDPEIRGRVSWDAPIHGLDDVKELPWEPDWLNIKPSRFGSIKSLMATIEYCTDRDITMYGGGQFELDVGRGQLQLLASLWYPDGPNDIAPQPYNLPTVPEDLPAPPLSAPTKSVGFRWE